MAGQARPLDQDFYWGLAFQEWLTRWQRWKTWGEMPLVGVYASYGTEGGMRFVYESEEQAFVSLSIVVPFTWQSESDLYAVLLASAKRQNNFRVFSGFL